MNSSVILLSSITQANKAKQLLSNYGIKCAVEKVSTQRGGCSFGLRVHSDTDKVCRLLSVIDVECGENLCGGKDCTQRYRY